MNRAKWMVFIALVALPAMMFTAACNSATKGADDGEQSLQLRSYTVPPQYASEVSSIINSLLSRQPNTPQIGKARIGPGGVIVVAAPFSVQSGIERMIADIVKAKPEPPPIVSLTYWIVVGNPGKQTSWPPQLNEIEPALKAVSGYQGPMSFSLQERLKVQCMSGESAVLTGSTAIVRQKATVRQGSVLGDIYISLTGVDRSFTTQVQIGLNKTLVLGQSGYQQQPNLRGRKSTESEPESNIFYIVRADAETGIASQ